MMLTEFPRPLATVVGEIIGGYYYHHRTIETLFYEAGASGDVPEGSCVTKVTEWLIREGKRDPGKALSILGKVVEEFMDGDITRSSADKPKDKTRLEAALNRYSLAYGFGGRIYGAAVTVPSRSLGQKLRELSIAEVEEEFYRAHRSVDADPAAAVTAACAILEALCKAYIAEHGLDLPSNQTIKPVWGVVSKHLKIAPESVEEDDLKRILSGLTSIVDGIGSYRTHAGSAHGHGRRQYKVAPRHARLAVHSAHTLCLFVMETWQARRSDG
ncbi:abortive infection family protein [Stenotrophomonas sp. W1S232]|uniref:Abortive infection family protein n=1 Tax=Stenotrophomonas koreensis TaxID=266128 RepID=A0A7W3V0L8_9GAMM|nr:abortive infection family protein [Stenotrophomonas koreensis]MBB1117284.1 abortive infection family protein [Stenotrophomonas koreensis]MBB1118074.1 abortive infection family protein [Stenotrophomonas koreensis]